MVETLTREEINRMIESPALSINDIVAVVKEELDIEIDSSLEREQIGDAIFKAYNVAMLEVEEQKQKVVVEKVTKDKKKLEKLIAKDSRKQIIKDLLEQGIFTQAQIVEEIDEKFGYKIKGTSSRQRVGKVIRPLIKDGTLEKLADGVLRNKE